MISAIFSMVEGLTIEKIRLSHCIQEIDLVIPKIRTKMTYGQNLMVLSSSNVRIGMFELDLLKLHLRFQR